jgi:Zn-dependent protease with chaperone function
LTLASEHSSASTPQPTAVEATYFDGRHSTAHSVRVAFTSPLIVVEGEGFSRSATLHDVTVTEPLGTAPRLIQFRDGAFCEIEGASPLWTLLDSQSLEPHRVSRWQGNLRWVVVSALLFVAGLYAGYNYAVPALAIVAAERVPAPVINLLSREVMSALDKQMFEPTAVAADRQAGLTERFGRLRFPSGAHPGAYQIVFRRSDVLGANAMALPSGTIVVTDELVALTSSDEEIVAVLAHEAGHVARRHGLRQLFQNSVVALAITWLIGDISVLAAAAPTALLQANYSRDLEREADAYAVDVLRLNDISPEYFARMLERFEEGSQHSESAGGSPLDYLSSHPVTGERIERVRQSR